MIDIIDMIAIMIAIDCNIKEKMEVARISSENVPYSMVLYFI